MSLTVALAALRRLIAFEMFPAAAPASGSTKPVT